MTKSKKALTSEQLAQVADLPSREAAKVLGVGKSTINNYRALAAEKPETAPQTTEQHSDGSKSVTAIRDRPVTLQDARDWIASSGDNPDDYKLAIKSIAYGADLFSNKLSAWPKHGTLGFELPDTSDLVEDINDWDFNPIPLPHFHGNTMVLCAADWQAGKVDWLGDSTALSERILASFERAAQYAIKHEVSDIVLADLGDVIENFNNVSSQRGTNDLALTEQIRLVRRLMLRGVHALAQVAPVTYVAVPSNHGSVRLGPKSPENHVLDDFGIELAHQIADVVSFSENLNGRVTVVVPEAHHESVAIKTLSGTTLGFAHGHQVSNPDKLGDYWKGQSHGRMPIAQADIALFGHWHSFRVQHSGDARWLMVAPTMDNGSSWFTNKTGERSQTGMLAFTTDHGSWDNIKIL